jgi:predicted secreted protein
MSVVSMFAIYFVMWWIVLFAVLPFGIKNAAEQGVAVEEGHEPGAPVAPQIARKAVITTLVSAAIFALFYWIITSGLFSLDDLPFYRGMPKVE